jgi:hypothetical protein
VPGLLIPLFYSLGILALAWVGGWHTDRFVSWGIIGYLPVIGIVGERLLRGHTAIWRPALLLAPLAIAHLLAHWVWIAWPDARHSDLHPHPGEGTIHHIAFAVYGDGLSIWHYQAVGMGEALRKQLGVQFFALLLFAAGASFILWYFGRRSLAQDSFDPPP